jgi:4-diphosphocytidyl-2-C-methyl-D-erythritol kinase
MVSIHSHAKANLFLNVNGRLASGYHEIQSFFLKLLLSDRIHIEPSYYTTCIVDSAEIADENIVLKTIRHFTNVYNISKSFRIRIQKNIPVAAGLGGGSSNAAAVLKLLPQLCGVEEVTMQQLMDIALEIGADVPFFLNDKNAFVSGVGEKLMTINLGAKFFILLINPNIKILSKDCYSAIGFKNFSEKIVPDAASIMKEILHGKNDLEEYAKQKYPVISKLINDIRNQKDCMTARMSGSGSTCLGIFDHEERVLAAVNNLSNTYPQFWLHYESASI